MSADEGNLLALSGPAPGERPPLTGDMWWSCGTHCDEGQSMSEWGRNQGENSGAGTYGFRLINRRGGIWEVRRRLLFEFKVAA